MASHGEDSVALLAHSSGWTPIFPLADISQRQHGEAWSIYFVVLSRLRCVRDPPSREATLPAYRVPCINAITQSSATLAALTGVQGVRAFCVGRKVERGQHGVSWVYKYSPNQVQCVVKGRWGWGGASPWEVLASRCIGAPSDAAACFAPLFRVHPCVFFWGAICATVSAQAHEKIESS